MATGEWGREKSDEGKLTRVLLAMLTELSRWRNATDEEGEVCDFVEPGAEGYREEIGMKKREK